MRTELESRLTRVFRDVFVGANMPENELFFFDGFKCLDGWALIIYKMAEELDEEIKRWKKKHYTFTEKLLEPATKFLCALSKSAYIKLMRRLIKKYPRLNHPRVHCVKENYGVLNVYMTNETEIMKHIISRYMMMTMYTCEICGKIGESRRTPKIIVRCDRCFNG